MPKRIVLTGASGFTGHYLVEQLRREGHELFLLQLRDASGVADGPNSLSCDLAEDFSAVQQALKRFEPTHAIHLAALAHVTESSAAEYYRVNVIGTETLLRALASLAEPPEKVVLASSANIYGNCTRTPIVEDETPAPVNHYAASKLAMEHIARTYTQCLPIVLVRPFNYTGVGQPESYLVPKIVAAFARREPVIKLGNIDISRDFSDVRFVAETYRRLLDVHQSGITVNICSGRAVSVRAIIEMLTAISGHRMRIEVDPALVRANDILELRGSDARLRAVIGDLPHIELRRTLEWMYAARCG